MARLPRSASILGGMIVLAKLVIAEHLNDPAVRDCAAGTLLQHPLQLGFQGHKSSDPCIDRGQLTRRDGIGGVTGPIRFVRQAEKLPNGLQRKPQVA